MLVHLAFLVCLSGKFFNMWRGDKMKKRKLVLWNPKPFEQEVGERLYPPLSLGIIASLMPSNWEVVIRDEFFEEFRTEPCDLVGITAMTCHALRAYEMADQFRKMGITTMMGGIHASVCSEEALEFVDVVVKGEVEDVLNEIISDFENNSLKRLYEAKEPVDLAKVPQQAFHLYNPKYNWGIIQTTRGCAANCEFCAVTALNGATYRKRPVDNVIEELKNMPQKSFFFADDNLLGFSHDDHQRFKELCEKMIESNINKIWIAQVPVQFSDNEELIKIAQKAGCIGVCIGIESGSLAVLSGKMNKRMNVKYLESAQFAKKIQKHGIQVFGSFIVGNDEDGLDCFKQTFKTIKKLKLAMAHVGPLVPYPETRLFERMRAEGRLIYTNFPQDWKHYKRSKFPLYKLSKLTSHQLKDGTIWLWKKLFSRFSITQRACMAFISTGKLKNAKAVYRINKEWGKLYNSRIKNLKLENQS